jgi:phage terminase large subunit-like protein
MRQKIFASLPPGYKYYKQEGIIRLPKPWSSEIHVKSCDAGREKFQGAGILAAWFDEEPKGLPGEEIFGEVYARRAPGVPLRIFMTFTPLQGLSWSYRRLWNQESEERYPGVETFLFDLHDCSKALGGFLTDEEIETIEMGYNEWEREARVHGKYTIMGGTPFFSPKAIAEQTKKCVPGKRFKISCGPGQSPILEEHDSGPLTIYRPPAEGRHYIIGVDPAGGVGRDASVASVWDREDLSLVAEWYSNRIHPDLFASDSLLPLGAYYRQALMVVETNGEHGGTVVSNLKGRYSNLYMRQEWDKIDMKYVNEYGFRTTNRTRGRILDALSKSLREAAWSPNDRILREMMTIVLKEDGKAEHMDGCNDDAAFAAGIALAVNYESPRPMFKPWSHYRTHIGGAEELQWMAT